MCKAQPYLLVLRDKMTSAKRYNVGATPTTSFQDGAHGHSGLSASSLDRAEVTIRIKYCLPSSEQSMSGRQVATVGFWFLSSVGQSVNLLS